MLCFYKDEISIQRSISECQLQLEKQSSLTNAELAVPKFCRELGRVLNSNKSINCHHHMKDNAKIGHLTKYNAFRVNRDEAMNLEIWFKIQTNVSNFETTSPKII